ncbi:sensor domain-containing diguanylate cyclase [Erwinia sp. S38]|uniref:sensor domain-containing diguanylate cyclase n=1 Tax=Erwinia sp. S38 TaxID=2769338 RepID=UPI00190DF7D0|nr:sensor domain-containing diguanylate cyclase [Erwinia sp. S38]
MLTSLIIMSCISYFQRENIRETLADRNAAYAQKVASTTEQYFSSAQKQLAWSADFISLNYSLRMIRSEVERVYQQSDYFNSVIFVSKNHEVLVTTNKRRNMDGLKVFSENSFKAISLRKPIISDPYISVAGNLVVVISQPVFSKGGNYIGYLGGTIYLKDESMLSRILNQHYYGAATKVRILSDGGVVIYDRDVSLIGKSDLSHKPSKTPSLDIELTRRVSNPDLISGEVILNGVAWHIIVSSNQEIVNNILFKSISNAVPYIFFLVFIVFLGGVWFSGRISIPLEKLAKFTSKNDESKILETFSNVNTWYDEAEQLRKALQSRFLSINKRTEKLKNESMTDHMTGILNRRGFFRQLNLLSENITYSLMMIDVDNFKMINDKFGHDEGDIVLKEFSGILKSYFKKPSLVCRYGGEEFIVLMKDSNHIEAIAESDRIKNIVSSHSFGNVGKVSFSAGLVTFVNSDVEIRDVLLLADSLLYKAKKSGRNVVFNQTYTQVD